MFERLAVPPPLFSVSTPDLLRPFTSDWNECLPGYEPRRTPSLEFGTSDSFRPRRASTPSPVLPVGRPRARSTFLARSVSKITKAVKRIAPGAQAHTRRSRSRSVSGKPLLPRARVSSASSSISPRRLRMQSQNRSPRPSILAPDFFLRQDEEELVDLRVPPPTPMDMSPEEHGDVLLGIDNLLADEVRTRRSQMKLVQLLGVEAANAVVRHGV
ncbi:hypothetical protein MKEN_01307800 [Mycena kentingensis (nom. inval.)]|nr:hypothetical protein MKEN_01307800 [Mycena kentingensis (nom. inval.)]